MPKREREITNIDDVNNAYDKLSGTLDQLNKLYNSNDKDTVTTVRERLDKLRTFSGTIYALQRTIRELDRLEHNWLENNCKHEWIIDRHGMRDPCGPSPKICKKCGI
jgi:hypothetical protein